jgi:hypothetical protein
VVVVCKCVCVLCVCVCVCVFVGGVPVCVCVCVCVCVRVCVGSCACEHYNERAYSARVLSRAGGIALDRCTLHKRGRRNVVAGVRVCMCVREVDFRGIQFYPHPNPDTHEQTYVARTLFRAGSVAVDDLHASGGG